MCGPAVEMMESISVRRALTYLPICFPTGDSPARRGEYGKVLWGLSNYSMVLGCMWSIYS